MKRLFILAVFTAMFCCTNVLGADKIQFTTIKTRLKTPACECNFSIEYPVGNSFVENHIKECINEMLGGTYTGDLNNGNALAKHYAKEREKIAREGQTDASLREELRDMGYGCESLNEARDSVYVAYENSKLINICYSTFRMQCGATYFDSDDSFLTVRKSDGRAFGMDMLNEKINTSAFHRLLIEGLKDFFWDEMEIPNIRDEQLSEYTYDPKGIGLPKGNKLRITDRYVALVYAKGEIADNMISYVESRIPINKILPYLKAPLRSLLTSSNTNIIENKVDTLAYAFGLSQSKSLKEAMHENGIDTIKHEEFDKGFLKTAYRVPKDTLLGNITNLSEEYVFGMRMGVIVSSRMIPGVFYETGWFMNPHRFVKGLYDGLNDDYQYFSHEEATNVSERLVEELKNEEYKDNLLASKRYVDNYSKLSSVKQIPGTSVYYKVLKQGHGAKPTEESSVVVHFEGMNIQDEVITTTYESNEPATLSLREIIKGMKEALVSMNVGSIWECVIPYEEAYGSESAGDEIPPYSALKFKIELLSIEGSDGYVNETHEEQDVPKTADNKMNIANEQSPKFAAITDEEVCFRKAPSTTAAILMFHFENEGSWNYCWAYDANDELTVEYRDKGSIVQVISKQDDWYKVRYYPANGLGNDVPEDDAQYIEGWIKGEYLKMVEPIHLTWDNINTVIEKDNNRESAMKYYAVDDANLRQTLFIQNWSGEGGGICMLYGKIENNHLNIYGSTDDLMVEWYSDNAMRGIAIKKEDGHNVLHYGGNVASNGIDDYDSQDVDIRKCTPQMREQILKAISNKLFSRRYYFNIGCGGVDEIRSFEIRY